MIGGLKPYPAYKDSGVGWLGEVPEHWEVTFVKRRYAIQLGKMLQNVPKSSEDRLVPYLKALHVQWFAVRTTHLPQMWASSEEILRYGVAPGDLLVCEGGEGGRCGIIKRVEQPTIIQNALHRVRPIRACTNEYLQFVMSSVAATGWFDALNDKATIAHFTRQKFAGSEILLPPLPEQTTIVRFLAWADRRIRRVIRSRQRRIKLLKEYKQAVIHRAVTGQIDVRTGQPYPAYKPSGVPWLGEVPDHWEVLPGRTQFREVNDRGHHDEELLSVTISRGVVRQTQLLSDSSKKDSSNEDKSAYKLVQPGDIVYNKMRAWQGAVGLSAHRGIVSPAYIVQRPRNVRNASRYLHHLLRIPAFATEAERRSYGITSDQWSLRGEDFKNIYFSVPSSPEQTAIVRFLDDQTEKIEAAIAADRRQIDLLEEFRTRLIADVVTGKLDVRKVAANLPDEPHEDEGESLDVEHATEGKADFDDENLEAIAEEDAP